jgi:hypothetical protein
MDARKRMLVILGLGALANTAGGGIFLILWIGSLALEGSRQSQDDDPMVIFATSWPLIEVLITLIWVALSKTRYRNSKYRTAGDVIAVATLILSPILYYWALSSGTLGNEFFYFYVIMIGIPFFGHWTARILWTIQKEQAATATTF